MGGGPISRVSSRASRSLQISQSAFKLTLLRLAGDDPASSWNPRLPRFWCIGEDSIVGYGAKAR